MTTNDVPRTVQYDAAGNETSFFATRTYSPRNLLHQVEDLTEGAEEPHRLTYGYDGRGIRVIRAESPSDGPGTVARRYFLYAPELRLLSATRDDNPNVWGLFEACADKNVQYEIVWFADRPVAQVTPCLGARFTFADHLGTPILQTDATGTIIWRVEYEPFGNVYEMREGNRTDQPLRFPGQELAMTWEGPEENYNIFRWYRSGWGRYTQTDPVSVVGASQWLSVPRAEIVQHAAAMLDEPLRQNPFIYSLANPTGVTDPLGLWNYWCVRRQEGPAIAKSKAMAQALGVQKGKHGADERNALLHCYYSCMMSVECGDWASWSAGMAHEITGSIGITTINTPAEREMDVYNNREGRDCADWPCPGPTGCQRCCIGKFKTNTLRKRP